MVDRVGIMQLHKRAREISRRSHLISQSAASSDEIKVNPSDTSRLLTQSDRRRFDVDSLIKTVSAICGLIEVIR